MLPSLSSILSLAMVAVCFLPVTMPAAELDACPVLIELPKIHMQKSFRLHGLTSAKVILEVLISSDGSVTVSKVLKSPHEEFTNYAIEFATRCRFSPPTKDGKPVDALLKWPLLLFP